MTVQGDHQGIGVGNLSNANAEALAEILVYMVEKYGLDGINFEDEWAEYGENSNLPSVVTGSFSNLVIKLRAKLNEKFPDVEKLIVVKYIGYASSLSAEAAAAIDFATYAYYGANSYVTPSSPWVNAKWSAQALNLSNSYNAIYLNQIKNRSMQSRINGMGAILTHDLRSATERDPLSALQKIAEGAFESSANRDDIVYEKDWSAGGSQTITVSDIF